MAVSFGDRFFGGIARLGQRPLTALAILYRVGDRTFRDGFIHAGNLAYLSLVTLFPALLLVHAFMAGFGRTEEGRQAIGEFLDALPKEVAELLAPVIDEVVTARTGTALLLGALVALWTTSSFVETIRDLLRRAHDSEAERPFWQERLYSIVITMAALFLVMVAFFGQLILKLAIATLSPYLPITKLLVEILDISRLSGAFVVFLALWALFRALTPSRIRRSGALIWPGALIVAIVWTGTTLLLGPFMADAANFSLTYGAFTGVMLALLFFYTVGLGIVAGAQTNAALASRASVAETVAEWRREAERRASSGEARE